MIECGHCTRNRRQLPLQHQREHLRSQTVDGRAATLNALFDEWNDRRRGEPLEQAKIARYGTIDWLFRQYKTEKAYTEKVSPRSRPDYERIMQMICETVGKSGRRIGERQVVEVSPRAADKIYDKIINGPNGMRDLRVAFPAAISPRPATAASTKAPSSPASRAAAPSQPR